jgi:hypothetical protein
MSTAIHKANDLSEFLGIVAKFTDIWFPNEPTWGPWFGEGTTAINRTLGE